MDFAQDGDFTQLEAHEIATAAMWDGDSTHFVESMVAAGFLDRDENRLTIHDWEDYVGRLIEKRRANAVRMKRQRSSTPDECATNVRRTTDARAGATVPYRTVPNQTEQNSSANADEAVSTLPEWFQILSQDKRWTGGDPAKYVRSVETAFPGVDLNLEAHNAYEWLQSPKGLKKKVLRGFWTNWLKKSRNGASNAVTGRNTERNQSQGGGSASGIESHAIRAQRMANERGIKIAGFQPQVPKV